MPLLLSLSRILFEATALGVFVAAIVTLSYSFR